MDTVTKSIILGTLVGQGEQRLIFGYPEIFKADRRADVYIWLNHPSDATYARKSTVAYTQDGPKLAAIITTNYGDSLLPDRIYRDARENNKSYPDIDYHISVNNGLQAIVGIGRFTKAVTPDRIYVFEFSNYQISSWSNSLCQT